MYGSLWVYKTAMKFSYSQLPFLGEIGYGVRETGLGGGEPIWSTGTFGIDNSICHELGCTK